MTAYSTTMAESFDEKLDLHQTPQKTNVLNTRITSVLSASYADSEIRDALKTLDEKGTQNNAETRRRLRLDTQGDVLQRNGDIVKEFGQVAEVCLPPTLTGCLLKWLPATQAHWIDNQESE